MRVFKNIPVVNDLKSNRESYLREDLKDLETAMASSFGQEGGEIPVLPLTFFSTFIKKQASLYSGSFLREGMKDESLINMKMLDDEMKYHERYYHRDTRGAVYIYSKNNEILFKALEALNYFKQSDNINKKDYCFVQSEDYLVLLFIKENNTVKIYELTKKKSEDEGGDNLPYDDSIDMYTLVSAYDLDKELDDQSFKDEVSITKKMTTSDGDEEIEMTLKDIPVAELSYRDIKQAVRNYVSDLETRRIISGSFGTYHGDPKMVTQAMIESDMDEEEGKAKMKNFGRRNSLLMVPINGKLHMFDTGDLTPLIQQIGNYNGFIEQQCLVSGVDFHALIPQSKTGNDIESGESKKLTMDYINDYRKDFYTDFNLFETVIFDLINKIFDINNDGMNIRFEDREVAQTKEQKRAYAAAMENDQYFTHVEGYAFARGMTIKEAEAIISKVEEDEPEQKPNTNDKAIEK